MKSEVGIIKLIETSIKNNWYSKAFTDYKGVTFQYKDVARKVEKIHIVFEQVGIQRGDKIAICGKNSANWSTAFLAITTYGAVAVPILHEFKSDQVHNIVNHSDAKILFVGQQVWENLNEESMPSLIGICNLTDWTLPISRNEELTNAVEHLNEYFCHKFPCRFQPEDINYIAENSLEDLAIINYTSGTTGFSKGVMLPYRSILSNVMFCNEKIGLKPGDRIVSMLPMGHVFGMLYDLFYGFTSGAHILFLTRIPSPKIIANSFAEIQPRVISCVPLIIEKIFKNNIIPQVDNKIGKLIFKLPVISDKVKEKVRKHALEAFGGNFIEILIGGAPFNSEIERFVRSINFPYTIVYGMTECGPTICHSHWSEMRYKSCGKSANGMEVKVDSDDPYNVPGELICRGDNLMLGYYKNEADTKKVIDNNGWLHTGDMAVVDKDGFFYIKGRCKNILLTSTGQNIYPEEIESLLNNMPYVNESVIVLQSNKLIALVFPDADEALNNGLNEKDIENAIGNNIKQINSQLPSYSQISSFKLFPEEFEKTAKKSIKRYLYQNIV